MMELTTYTELEIAHRLMSAYAQKCRSLHGHRYEVEITVTARELNDDGMIVDFKKLKEVVKTVLDDKWDHGACFNVSDPLGEAVLASGSERVHIIKANPTLEWMVERWALDLQVALDIECPGVAVSMLKASETARNTVTWRCNCLPWERSERVDDSNKPIRASKEKDESLDICRGEKEKVARIAELRRKIDAALRRRRDAQLSPTPKNDWARMTVKVDTLTPADEMEEGIEGVEEEHYVPIEDTALYLVQFRTETLPYSTTVRTSLTGDALVARCYEAALEFVTYNEVQCIEANVVVLNITKLPG